MEYSQAMLTEISNRLDLLANKLKNRAIDWWWLDQGDAPIISVPVFKVEGKNVKKEYTPKISLPIALKKLRDSLNTISNLSIEERIPLIHEISRALYGIYNIIENILDANRFMDDLNSFVSELKKTLGESSSEYQKKIYNLVMRIKNIFLTDPMNWIGQKTEVEGELKSLKDILKEKLEATMVHGEKITKEEVSGKEKEVEVA